MLKIIAKFGRRFKEDAFEDLSSDHFFWSIYRNNDEK